MAKNTLDSSKDKKQMDYNVLASIVDTDDTFMFLQGKCCGMAISIPAAAQLFIKKPNCPNAL